MAQRQFRSDDTSQWTYGFGNGSDGALSISADTTEAPIDSACTGNAASTSLSATNVSFATGQIILIHKTRTGDDAGEWELNKIASYSAGTITLAHPLINTYAAGSQVLVMKQYSSVTIQNTFTLTAKAWTGTVGGILAFFCSGSVTFQGTGKMANAGGAASGVTPAARQGFRGGTATGGSGTIGCRGEGDGGDTAAATRAHLNNAGGGGNGTSARGGQGGGHAAAGSGNGEPGEAVGTASLVSMHFGGAGGSAGTGNSGQGNAGGGGGGIILIIAKDVTQSGTGVTSVSGGQGGNGVYGGGGGAGGSILIKCQTASLGTNLFTSIAGPLGTGSTDAGFAGAVGRIHIDYKTSLTGTTTPTLDSTNDLTLDYRYGGGFLLNML